MGAEKLEALAAYVYKHGVAAALMVFPQQKGTIKAMVFPQQKGAPGRPRSHVWDPTWDGLLGTKPDQELAAVLDVPVWLVSMRRRALGLRFRPRTPGPARTRDEWSAHDAAVRSIPDCDLFTKAIDMLAETVGSVTTCQVRRERSRRRRAAWHDLRARRHPRLADITDAELLSKSAVEVAKILDVDCADVVAERHRRGYRRVYKQRVYKQRRSPRRRSPMVVQRERKAFKLRARGLSLRQIGQALGVSGERVRQMLKSAAAIQSKQVNR